MKADDIVAILGAIAVIGGLPGLVKVIVAIRDAYKARSDSRRADMQQEAEIAEKKRQDDIDYLRDIVETLQVDRDKMRARIESLEDDNEKHHQENDALRADIARLNVELETERKARIEAEQKVADLESKLKIATDSLRDATAARQDRIKRIIELEAEVKRIPGLEAEVARLKAKLAKLEKSTGELKGPQNE